MATLPSCAIPPSVVNAQPAVVYPDGRTADYTCVTGFKMSGLSRINCNNTTLQWYYSALPTCTVIDYSSTYLIWFYGLIAGFLGLLALMSVCCLLAYCCGWGGNSVSSLDGTQSSEGCCGRSRRRRRRRSLVEDDDVRMSDVENAGLYYVPVARHGYAGIRRDIPNPCLRGAWARSTGEGEGVDATHAFHPQQQQHHEITVRF